MKRVQQPAFVVYEVRGPRGVYVGCARRIAARWGQHRSALNRRLAKAPYKRMLADATAGDYAILVLSGHATRPRAEGAERAAMIAAVSRGDNLYNSRLPAALDVDAGLLLPAPVTP